MLQSRIRISEFGHTNYRYIQSVGLQRLRQALCISSVSPSRRISIEEALNKKVLQTTTARVLQLTSGDCGQHWRISPALHTAASYEFTLHFLIFFLVRYQGGISCQLLTLTRWRRPLTESIAENYDFTLFLECFSIMLVFVLRTVFKQV